MRYLDKLKIGTVATIVKIDAGQGLARQLAHLGIKTGINVRVMQNTKGPIIIAHGNSRIALGRGMSRKIHVEESKNDGQKKI